MEELLIIDVRNAEELSILTKHFNMLGWKSSMIIEGTIRGIHCMPTKGYPSNFEPIGFPINVEYKDNFLFAYRDGLTYWHPDFPYCSPNHPKHISVYEMFEVINKKYYVLL